MISLCVCTHNPRPAPFARCLAALRVQGLPRGGLELVVVDNRSKDPLDAADLGLARFPFPARVVREDRLGLTQARLCALRESRGDLLIFADDDNLLAPDYAVEAERFFDATPRAGAASGRSVAEFEAPPPAWCDKHIQLALALRNLQEPVRLMEGVVAPLGAGLVIRREAFLRASRVPFILSDRRGRELSSGGDSELCHRVRLFGWELWYDRALVLTHLIAAERLTLHYFERLHRSFGRDWPYLEFYWLPDRPWRRLRYLHRGLVLRLRSRFRRRRSAPATPAEAREHLEGCFEEGMAETLWRLSRGPACWRTVQQLRRETGIVPS